MKQQLPEREAVRVLSRKLRCIFWIELLVLVVLIAAWVLIARLAPKWEMTVSAVFVIGSLMDLLCMLFVAIYSEDVRKARDILRARDGVPEEILKIEKTIRTLNYKRIAAACIGVFFAGLHIVCFVSPRITDILDEFETLFLLLAAPVIAIGGVAVFGYLTLKVWCSRRELRTKSPQSPKNRRT